MKIAVAGATGLIGSALYREFLTKDWKIEPVTRSEIMANDMSLTKRLEGCQVVINLSGAPILQRWTKKNLKTIYESRILTTRKLVNAIRELDIPPELYISTSASGIYEDGGPYTESDFLLSSNILGQLCQDWEKEAFQVEDYCKLVIFRLGVVLDIHGGALSRLLPFFKAGLGGKIGHGNQFFPWVHLNDVVRAFMFIIENQPLTGVINLMAPQIITNSQFTKVLAETLKRPAVIPIPPFVLQLLYGKASDTLCHGQAVIPKRLTDSGFSFHFPQIKMAIVDLMKK